jgi:DNA-binding transcriptional ArsR family regulator
MRPELFANPFRAGAGHMPPYLAGRTQEQDAFRKLLNQTVITDNLIIIGLRGVGKTVLLAELKPIALQSGWLWAGDDFSEQASLTEERIATKIITDLSVNMSQIFVKTQVELPFGFTQQQKKQQRPLGFKDLEKEFQVAPGLVSDKLKHLLRVVGAMISGAGIRGVVFAYDEAQLLSDHASKDEYPLSLLLDVFQSIQKSPGGLPFLLVLTGLPTLTQKLVNARTYSSRMFQQLFLDRLSNEDAEKAITVPIDDSKCPVHFTGETVKRVILMSGGYPYYIQFICREIYDLYLSLVGDGKEPVIPETAILRKLDQHFYFNQWSAASDQQRIFMTIIAQLPSCEDEFAAREITRVSKDYLDKPYSTSSVNQYLARLTDAGLVYKNRRGKYQFAVPLISRFINRQIEHDTKMPAQFRSSIVGRRPS